MKFTESTVEEATLEWFQALGYDRRLGFGLSLLRALASPALPSN
jgi:hypothetical protein